MLLETERLRLRNWQEDDVEHYLVLSKDIGYNCFAHPGRFAARDRGEARAKVRERIILYNDRKLGKFPIFLRSSGDFIGTCGLEAFYLDGRTEIELGYRLCIRYWGRGYAAEAAAAILDYGFQHLRLEKIIAFALPQNKASLRVLEKIGFRYCRDFIHADLPHSLYELTRDSANR